MSTRQKAVLYARVSSKEQEREGFSIPAQRKLLHEFADSNSLEIVAEFCEAETAKQAGRQQFQEMLAYLNAHPDVRDILVEKTDRLYRNLKDFSLLDHSNLRVHLVKDGHTLSRDSGSNAKFMHGIKVLMAKNFCDNLSEEVRKGRREKAEQGLWPNPAPFGYQNRLDDHTIEPDPLRAPYVVKAFEMMASRQHSLQQITRYLNEAGALTKRSGNKLFKNSVQIILRRELYYGSFRWDGQLYEGKHQPLISKTLFDQAQAAMGGRQKPKALKHESLYGRVLKCGHCGCAITADHKIKPSGKHYTYYYCTNGKKSCGQVVYLREEVIDQAFSDALETISISPDVIELTRTALLESAKTEREFHERASQNLTQQIATLQRRIERCYTDHLDDNITAVEWRTRTAAWKAEQANLKLQLDAHDRADLRYMEEGVRLLELASRAHELFNTSMTPAEKREIVGIVLSNPRIEDGTVRYEMKMPFTWVAKGIDSKEWLGN